MELALKHPTLEDKNDTKEVPTVYLESWNSVLIYFVHIELIIIRRLSRQTRLHGLNRYKIVRMSQLIKLFKKSLQLAIFVHPLVF